jgi:retron-type reverse transcriptase
MTAAEYERNLEVNLQSLLNRAKSGTYQAPPVRRVHIPKGGSTTETRPIGIPTLEDKILQRAVVMLLEPIYEQDFYDCSFGFRPRRSAHGALESFWKQTMDSAGCTVLEVDIDSIPHDKLMAALRTRIADRSMLKLIRMWLQAPVVEEQEGQRKEPRWKS